MTPGRSICRKYSGHGRGSRFNHRLRKADRSVQEIVTDPFYMKRDPVIFERDDDRWIGRLLRSGSAGHVEPAEAGDCLDADALAAWADGTLGRKELVAAELHASTCSRCLALLAAVERTAPPLSEQAQVRRAWFPWLVPLTAAAAAVAIWVFVPEQQIVPVATVERSVSAPPPSSPGSFADSPPASSPAEPQAERPSAQAARQAPLRDDAVSPRAREQQKADREEVRQEAAAKEISLGAAAADRAAPTQNADAAAAAPVAPPPASVDKLSESAAVMQRRMAFSPTVIESATQDGVIRWRVVGALAVERSTDSGKTWVRVSTPPGIEADAQPARTVVAIQAIDAVRATVRTSDGRTLSTDNGGTTWVPVQEKPPAPF